MADESKAKRKRRRRSKGSQTDTDKDDMSQEDMSCSATCQEMFEKINEKLDLTLAAISEIESLKVKVKDLEQKSQDLEHTLVFAQGEIEELQNNIKNMADTMDIMQKDVEQLSSDLARENSRSIKLEGHSRRNNLRFYNIPETPNETYQDAENTLRSFIDKELQGGPIMACKISLERVHRVGPEVNLLTKPRALIAKFTFFKEKEQVRKMASHLKGSKFGLSEDFVHEVLQVRKNLLPVLKEAKRQKKKAFLKHDQLIIEGQIYKGMESFRPYATLNDRFNR
ncbi:hypothetical protein QZH41_007996 [Actinostola sp. cb2023]|nr:hypothetical protein QZH41_006996 [Actinostola sp. cb2023]KAK3742460.1 hypothetical protein QZH41_007996 [Actinostola sp. cb2023]